MNTTRFSRRELLKGGALVISFSILAPLSKALGQATVFAGISEGDPRAVLAV